MNDHEGERTAITVSTAYWLTIFTFFGVLATFTVLMAHMSKERHL
jgi:hypothetical protein